MIKNFSDTATEHFFYSGTTGKRTPWSGCSKVAKRKLDMLEYAEKLQDLSSPPNNRLELLKGSLKGFYSIRINDQFRVVFRWEGNGASDVRIMDYHS